jgi:hypothetical protein
MVTNVAIHMIQEAVRNEEINKIVLVAQISNKLL